MGVLPDGSLVVTEQHVPRANVLRYIRFSCHRTFHYPQVVDYIAEAIGEGWRSRTSLDNRPSDGHPPGLTPWVYLRGGDEIFASAGIHLRASRGITQRESLMAG